FTGASHDKIGKFLQADGGTLFLDEVATASPALQVKLLRVLQDREFEPVGGNVTHKVDVRMVLATNENLEDCVKRGTFREDLYYRINVISITQPPLRDRIGDIPLLAAHYLQVFNEQTGRTIGEIDEMAMQAMQHYHWPGNVRELVNVIERAVVLCRSSHITASDLPEKMFANQEHRANIEAHLGGASLKSALTEPERHLIIQALEASGWNRQKTAKTLGINRTTLYKKMKRYEIDFESVYKHV
ncbi:MAG TPA: sigma-54 dependent transcriptional regulator, partial [Planctomycetaceae bacterium]|nr:sigma-54 dependent transcriptional regulator [Planctomycetaceae bacterium]